VILKCLMVLYSCLSVIANTYKVFVLQYMMLFDVVGRGEGVNKKGYI
jgi:hypothetical protein